MNVYQKKEEKKEAAQIVSMKSKRCKIMVVLTTVKFITFNIQIVIAKLTIMVTNSRRTKKYKHLFRHP